MFDCCLSVFFFKHKTAYEMRISDLEFRRVLVRSAGGCLGLSDQRFKTGVSAVMEECRVAAAFCHELAGVDQAGYCPLHRADAEENVAECGIALVGKAFRQLKTTVFVDRNAALQVLREPALIVEGNLGARPGLNRDRKSTRLNS